MRRLWFATLVLVGCRIGDLVQAPPAGRVLQFSVQPSHADSGQLIVPPVQVTVLDEVRRPDTTYRQTVTVTLIQNPGGASLSGTTVASVVRGVATFPTLRLNRPGTGYVLRASASERPAAMSAAFDVSRAPTATSLAFTRQPVTTQSGSVITPAVLVAVRSAAGNVIATYSGTVTIALSANTSGGVLSGTTAVQASSGIATFAALRVTGAAAQYTLTAAANGLTGATSTPFSLTTPPGPATYLVFSIQPSAARVNKKIEPPVQVLVLDPTGRPVVTFTGAVTIDLATNGFGAKVTGVSTVNAVSGVATFVDLRVDKVGTGYQLRAAFAGQGAVALSASFAVAP